MQLLQASLEGLVAGAVLHHGERLGGRLAIGPEEGDTVTVACGIDTDADAVEGRGGGHKRPPETRDGRRRERRVSGGRRESPPGILGKVILVMSGQSRMMYQCLEPKPEGTIFSKRSKPQGTTALLTTQEPVSQTGWNRTYKEGQEIPMNSGENV